MISSFDVFDTLLTRKVAHPTSVFLLVGARAAKAGLIDFTPTQFYSARVRAEISARTHSENGEVTLEDIYGDLSADNVIEKVNADELRQIELEIEAAVIVAVPGSRRLTQTERAHAGRLLFVSDMYLSEAFIRGQLQKHGLYEASDRLYVSSSWGASKSEGSLFRTVLREERLHPRAVRHFGDRIDSDVASPRKLGIKAQHHHLCGLTRYEEMLEDVSADSTGFTSLLAGISRLTRLEFAYKTEHLKALSQVASSLIAPLITFYALWLLSEAEAKGLQRLYFVARDGYLVKRIADSLIVALGLKLETRYLYGSRQAWHLPAISEFSEQSLSWLFEKTRTLTLRIILSRLQMNPEDISDVLMKIGWPMSRWDQALDDISLQRLKGELLGDCDFQERVIACVVKRRELTRAYLEQEGLYDDTHWAMVDLGWHGRLQQSLESILEFRKPRHTVGLYFALFLDSPALKRLEHSSYCKWNLHGSSESNQIPSLVFLLESFCTAPHGTTTGYIQEPNGRVKPVLREEKFAPLEKWGLAAVHAAVERFADHLKELPLESGVLGWDSRKVAIGLLEQFSKRPSPSEGRAWGAFPYEDEQGGVVKERLTAPYELNWANLRSALTFGEEEMLPTSWNVLWHGAQRYAHSASSEVVRCALAVGRAKIWLGRGLRRLAHPFVRQ